MTKSTWRTPVVVLACGTLVMCLSLGVRNTYGLFLAPITTDLGWGREELSLAVALQALVWGIFTPAAGAVADKYGPGRVLFFGGAAYALGLLLMSQATTPLDATLSIGLLTGIAMACTMFPLVLAVIGRAAPESRRAVYLGIGSAGGSSGQIFLVPGTQAMLDTTTWPVAMLGLAAVAALIMPLSAALVARPASLDGGPRQTLTEAVREAMVHRGYVLLFFGYFVCGFQTMFVGTHLPALVKDFSVSPGIAATALAVLGIFNVIGCYVWGEAGGRLRAKYLLSWLYLLRSAVMAAFFLLPISSASVLVFAGIVGLLWLGTVPLTGMIVARIFGLRYMATLFGFCFVGHQVGSFLGIWLGGRLYDATGTYDAIWWISVALGVAAALIHWPIDDRPLARLGIAAAQRPN
ncbi:MAG: MFS transporter [Rhodospirillales bacterium]